MSTTAVIIIILAGASLVLLVLFNAMRQSNAMRERRPQPSEEPPSEEPPSEEPPSEEPPSQEPPSQEPRERETTGTFDREIKRIFISYRRDETAGYAGRIADRFIEHFGEDRVFRDLDSLEPGLDFAEVIQRAIDSTEVMIAVIGKNWLTATDAAGRKRLENPDDYVRVEIATALKRNTRVIPLLVQGAAMPNAEDLPEDLAPLTRRNAFELYDFSWNEQVQRLITTLDKVLGRRPV